MKRQQILTAFLALTMTLGLAASAFASPSVFPTGTTIYDPERAYNGFILCNLPAAGGGYPYLMDMNGNVVHDWNEAYEREGIPFAERSVLLPNGNILAMKQQNPRYLMEFDWDGNVVWFYQPEESPHHYVTRLANGNTVFLQTHTLSAEQVADAVNYSDMRHEEIRREGVQMHSDKVVEVNPAGEVVWEWALIDDPHYDINWFCPDCPVMDWTHSNTASIIPENKWYDAGDERFKPGNILLNPRNLDEIAIIDKETKLVIWTFKSDYQGGFGHVHEPEMIPKGYPGEGNIILFDNGLHSEHDGKSYILEINPVDKEIVWTYGAPNFYSSIRSSQTRLPNGNTLISEDDFARAFQVTSEGEVVWEYVNPITAPSLRTRLIPYDFCPQLADLPRSEDPVVAPVNNSWRLPVAR